MKYNLKDEVLPKITVPPQTISSATTVNGTGIDCQSFNELMALILLGAISATQTITVKLQDSSDNSSFNDITGATTSGITIDDTSDNKPFVIRLNKAPYRRYVRAVVTTGNTGATLIGVALLLADPQFAPVTQENTAVSVN